MYVIVEDGIVKTINVDKTIFNRAIEAPDDIIFGDRYENGTFIRVAERPVIENIPQLPTLEERVSAVEEVLLNLL